MRNDGIHARLAVAIASIGSPPHFPSPPGWCRASAKCVQSHGTHVYDDQFDQLPMVLRIGPGFFRQDLRPRTNITAVS